VHQKGRFPLSKNVPKNSVGTAMELSTSLIDAELIQLASRRYRFKIFIDGIANCCC
jgi:hypothetical protein